MDPTKSKSREVSCDMTQAAVERRLETVDELRELAIGLSYAKRLGAVAANREVAESATALSNEKMNPR